MRPMPMLFPASDLERQIAPRTRGAALAAIAALDLAEGKLQQAILA
jgi:hypothetical protein